MGRQPCCDKVGLKRGPWTIEEDHKLMNFIVNNGIQCWRMVPKLAGLLRCGKSCRLRWINYLRPDLKRGSFTEMEDNQIIQLHSRLGNRWSKIASHFPGRTDNEIKNHWNTRLKKKLKILSVDPVTHEPINEQTEKSDSAIFQEENDGTNNIPDQSDQESLAVKAQEEEDKADYKRKEEQKLEEQQEQITIMDETRMMDETSELLKSYEMLLCGSLDLEPWINQETNSSSNTSYSSNSLSIEESNNISVGESISIQEDSAALKQWVDSVDSFLSWDNFNHLVQEDLFFLGNSQQQCNLEHSMPKFV